MRAFASLLTSFALLVVCMPFIEAQDEKKPDVKKDEPKDKADTKAEPKKIVRADPSVVMSAPRFLVKIKDLKAEQKEVVVVHIDEKLHAALLNWDAQQQLNFRKDPKSLNKDSLSKYQREKQKLLEERFQGKLETFSVGDAVRVRSMFLPPSDKKLTPAEQTKLKNPPLPGYVADFGQLREGQIIEMYVVKQAPPKKAVEPAPKTPKFIGLDPTLNVPSDAGKLDVHMLVIQVQN